MSAGAKGGGVTGGPPTGAIEGIGTDIGHSWPAGQELTGGAMAWIWLGKTGPGDGAVRLRKPSTMEKRKRSIYIKII